MRQAHNLLLMWIMILWAPVACCAGAANAGMPAKQDPPTGSSTAQETPAGKEAAAEEDQEPKEIKIRNQYWFIGTSNYHLLLHESEDQINRQLNRPFGRIFRTWHRPTTFRDWSDSYLLWDLWAGYGRDLSERFSWGIYAGGGYGKIPNSNRYHPLGISFRVQADFSRISFMAGNGITFHPWGRPVYREGGLWKNIKASRPMTEMNIGYAYQIAIGSVKIHVPIFDQIARIREEKKYHLFWISPRIGIETPLTKNNTLNTLVGYNIFTTHGSEFNGYIFEFFIRHRF